MILLWVRLLLLFAAGIGAAGQFAKIAVAYPALEAIYPEAGAALGFAVSLLSLVGAALGLVAGMVVARLGYRRVLVVALALGAGLSALQATLPPLPVLLALRVVEGASHLAIVVAAPTLMAQIAPERQRAPAMALWSTFFGSGFALFAWLGAGQPAGLLILGHAGLMAGLALALAWALPTGTVEAAPARTDTLLRSHIRVYGDPALSAAGLGWLFYTLTFLAALTLLPLFSGAAWLGTLLPLLGIGLALTLVTALLRLAPAVRVVIWGFGLSATCALALGAAPGMPALWIALFAALSLVQAGSFAAIPQLCATARDRALANGAVAQMGNVGNLLGTPLLLAITSAAGPSGGAVALAACLAAGAAVHLGLAARRAARS